MTHSTKKSDLDVLSVANDEWIALQRYRQLVVADRTDKYEESVWWAK